MIILGDARDVLPTLDLSGCVVITDPPWKSGHRIDIVGAGDPAEGLWSEVAPLLGSARAVVVLQSSLDRPFAPPPLPFVQTCWLRSVPPSYRGRRILSHVAYVYGEPPIPPGKRVWSGESVSRSAEGRAARKASPHPCPFPLDHARWLVRWFAHGCRVVDPFCGGGTILRAAAEIGCDVLGIEVDSRWIDAAEASVAAGLRQMRIDFAHARQA